LRKIATIVTSLASPPVLPAEVVCYLNFHSSERLKDWNIQRTQCQCEGRNGRKYVCFVLSYQTCQIQMTIVLVGSVAFILKAECIPCTEAKL
jgi:hypothetical protein